MNKLAAIRIIYDDQSYSEEIPVTALAENIQWNESDTLIDILGSIDLTRKGNIQDQIDELNNRINQEAYNKPIDGIPKADLANSVQISLEKADTALQSYTETDPTVPAWAKQPNKPTYTAQEVGALAIDAQITVEVDNTLSIQGAAADAKKVGNELTQIKQNLGNQQSRAETAQALKINKPIADPNGTNGQILQTDGQGGTVWVNKQTDEQIANAVTDWLDDHVVPGSSTIIVDDTLNIQGAAADAKKAGDEITDLKEDLNGMNTATSSDVGKALKAKTITNGKVTEWEFGEAGSGLTEDIKQALLQIAEKVAYVDAQGQDYYNALEDALYPPVNLVSISAVYTQSGAVYTTDSLDALKDDLVVTAHYDDSSTETVTTYTLSGTLTVGTSTITVAYGGKTTTFNVTVSQAPTENFVKVNSPVINNKILEKNSTNVGYIRTNEVFNPGTSPWNIKFKFTWRGGGTSYQDIFDTVNSSNEHIRSLLYEISVGRLLAYAASSGATSWDISNGNGSYITLTENTEYYLDAYFTGTKYGYKISTDGVNWTDYYAANKTTPIAQGGYLAFGRALNGEFIGEIDLSTLEIYIDDKLWWQAYGTPKTVTSISAIYNQSGTVYTTDSLNSLKSDLVVTATYDDSSTSVIADSRYTLSGTLTVGTSVVTVTYSEKTTTFNVTVTEAPSVLTGYTEVGSPTISNNILTVADGKFIKTNVPFTPGSDSWEVICKYRRTESLGAYTDIVGSVDSSNASARGFLFELSNGTGTNGAMFASSNGTSWDITSSQQINTLPNASSWVWVSMSFTGTAYITKTSTDGETWTNQKEIASTAAIYDNSYPVGFGLKRNGYLKGEIDLTGCMIYKNGNLWWKAVA